jgi:transcriptional regulator with XRE-family HTH domain
MTFGEMLTNRLARARMSQLDLARRIDCDPSAVAQWCRGAWPPTFANLFKIAEALDTTPDRLLRGVVYDQVRKAG